jgi:hypothetical protein
MHDISPANAVGVFLSTAATGAVFIFFDATFNAAVAEGRRRRLP